MNWVIAVLLALILVAMISSNRDAAAGVKKVVRFAFIGTAMFFVWLVPVVYSIWFYNTYPKGDWSGYIGIACAALAPPLFLVLNRKAIRSEFKANKRAASNSAARTVAYLIAGMVAMPLYEEVKAINHQIGWIILFSAMVLMGGILLARSLSNPRDWREIWNGPAAMTEPWMVVTDAQDNAASAEQALLENHYQTAEDLTDEQNNNFRQARENRRAATGKRIEELSRRLESEKVARAKTAAELSVRKMFWWSVMLSIFGVIGITWDFGYDYLMGLTIFQGREWVAGAVVTVAMFCAVIGIFGVWGEFVKFVSPKVPSSPDNPR